MSKMGIARQIGGRIHPWLRLSPPPAHRAFSIPGCHGQPSVVVVNERAWLAAAPMVVLWIPASPACATDKADVIPITAARAAAAMTGRIVRCMFMLLFPGSDGLVGSSTDLTGEIVPAPAAGVNRTRVLILCSRRPVSRQENAVPRRFAGYRRDGSKRQTEVLGRAYGESGPPQSPASQPAMPAQKS